MLQARDEARSASETAGEVPWWAPTIAPIEERDRGEREHRAARGAGAGWRLVRQGACRTWLVTGLDWLIVAFAAVLAFFGFRQGFIVGVLSFAGFVARCLPRHAARPAACCPKGSSSPYAPAFGLVGRAARRRDPRERPRGRRLPPAPDADPARARRCSTARSARCSAPRSRSASSGSPRPSRRRPRAQNSCARTSSARRSCASSNSVLPPSGPILDALARLDPLPSITGPVARRRRAAARRRPRAGRAGAPRTRRARARHRLRARDRGLGLGGRTRTSSSPTRTSSPASRTPRSQIGGPRRRARRRADRLRPHRRHRAAARPRARPRRRCPSPPSAESGTSGRDPRLPGERPLRRAAGRIGRTQNGAHAERLRAGTRAAAADAAARAGAARATRAARSSIDHGRVLTTVFAVHRRRRARTAATGSPTPPSRPCSPGRSGPPAGPSAPVPAPRAELVRAHGGSLR